jgi:undecaprenyl-diphosphatase
VAVVLFHHTRNRVARAVAVVVIPLIVLAVSWARLYQGMHYLSDVIAGIVLGIVSLVVTDRVLRAAARRYTPERPFMGDVRTLPPRTLSDQPASDAA